jgi:hypothetical protein
MRRIYLSREDSRNQTVRDCASKYAGRLVDPANYGGDSSECYCEFENEDDAAKFEGCVRNFTGGAVHLRS